MTKKKEWKEPKITTVKKSAPKSTLARVADSVEAAINRADKAEDALSFAEAELADVKTERDALAERVTVLEAENNALADMVNAAKAKTLADYRREERETERVRHR